MTRGAAIGWLGVAVLALAAGGLYRTLSSPGQGAVGPPVAGGVPRAVPELRFADGAGAQRSLAEFRGRVILLNIWATWCTPCREEMPALDRLQTALGGPGFEVVALSMDREGVPIVKKFYEELGLRALRIYVDRDMQAFQKLGVIGIPATLLIDREGRELWRVVGPRQWDKPEEMQRIRGHFGRKDG